MKADRSTADRVANMVKMVGKSTLNTPPRMVFDGEKEQEGEQTYRISVGENMGKRWVKDDWWLVNGGDGGW